VSTASNSSDNIAILVFASNTGEALSAKWNKGNKLLDRLTEHAITQARSTDLPCYHYHQGLQRGQSFGQRISNAFQDLFELGYDRVIAIGNDCPQITTAHLLEAKEHLDHGDHVIAPATDGGFNLIGIHRERFDRDKFEQLAWQSDALYQQTTEYFNNWQAQITTMSTYGDIDTVEDIKRLLPKIKCAFRSLYDFLIKAVQRVDHSFSYQYSCSIDTYKALPFNKGSPLG
jgi:glycosyltransferase A (GT-A) superfamily protein (DUF2064 family)